MPSNVEQNLHTLLPTTNILPATLVATAQALLAQSKFTATQLKPEEEIARTFACCHIACQRLTHKLALDLGKVNPPCAPRIYKKLHSLLDGQLSAGRTSQPATPRTNRTVDRVANKTPASLKTPSLKTGAIAASPHASTKVTPAKRKRVEDTEEELIPEYLAKMSQHLCRSMNAAAAIPHVYAGLDSVMPYLQIEEALKDEHDTQRKRQRKPSAKMEALLAKTARISIEEDKLALLLVAIVQSAVGRMKSVELSKDEVEDIFGELLAYLRDRDDRLAERIYDDSSDAILMTIESLGARLQALPFWQAWLFNIPPLDSATTAAVDEPVDLAPPLVRASKTPLRRQDKHGRSESDIDEPGAAGLLPGLGTMFQPALDWLSDERRADYALWKTSILREIAKAEQQAT